MHVGARATQTNITLPKVNCTVSTDTMRLNCSDLIEGGLSGVSVLTVECQASIVNTPSVPTSSNLTSTAISPTVTRPDSEGSNSQSSSDSKVSAALGAVIGLLIVTQTLTIFILAICALRTRQQTNKQQQRYTIVLIFLI